MGDVPVHTADPVAVTDPPEPSRASELLCIAGDRSFTVRLPESGDLVLGRGSECGLVVDDPLVSRAHAQLLVVPDGLRLADLGSRHGTVLNGEPLTEPRLVRSGDVIGVGGTLLVVRRSPPARANPVTEQGSLVRRLGEELARAAEYERELSVVIVRGRGGSDAIAQRARVIDTVAPIGSRHVAVLAPELDRDEAAAWARQLLAHDDQLAIGIATAPYDSIDADALLGAARAACDAAAVGAIGHARDGGETITAGPQTILVVEPAMARLYELARRLARSTIPILIQGETGVGKELAAAAVHAASPRATGPFISVNCAAIPETLAESELFGYVRGAFSGAVANKAGYFEAATGGTLFLDEIGELSPATQARLLRVLENGELIRVGETTPRTVDIRIVAATNRDLQREVDAGRFRQDLYFRLGAARLEIPALRERPRDLARLVERVLTDACGRLGRAPLALSIGAALALFRHDWPGNVRELRHVLEYGAAAAHDAATELELWHLPPALAAAARHKRDRQPAERVATTAATAAPSGFRPIADEVRELERARMIAALRASSGMQNRAAELIEMPLRTFVTKLKRYAITPEEWRVT